MTTPTPSQQAQSDFAKDLAALNKAADDYQADKAANSAANTEYHDKVIKKLDSMTDVFKMLSFLIFHVFQNSTVASPSDSKAKQAKADGTVLGLFGDQLGIKGEALKVNSLLTKVHDDIQKITTLGGTDPQDVANVAKDLDSVLDALKTPALIAAMDPQSYAQMKETDTSLRDMFHITGSKTNNPDTKATYYFTDDPNDNGHLHTFGDMQDDMKKPGDKLSASEAYKGITNNFNSDTGMTQTVNSALNEQINQLTNFIKTIVGFYENALVQPWSKLVNTAVQNQRS